MSSLIPALPPDIGADGGGGGNPPPSPPAPSPENDDIIPPPAPVFPTLPPLLSPPLITGPIAAPPLPVVVVGTTPPPTPSIPSPSPTQPEPQPEPQPQPQPQPQPEPQPPITTPSPITNPPQKRPTPPSTSSPIDIKPAPSSGSNPASPAASPPPAQQPRDPPSPISRQPKTRGATQPSPSQPRPLRRKRTPAGSPPPSSPLPTSAVLPSPPPVALPVPQAPSGGAWLPFSPETPAPLPVFPGPPAGVISSPAAPVLGNPTNGLPSALAPSDSAADHQNIEAANAAGASRSSNGSSGSGFVVGLCVAGVLLLLLGAVFVILGIFCRRRQNKFADYGSGSMLGTSLSGFEDKASLSQYTKQDSNTSGHQVLVNVSTPQAPTFTSNGLTIVNAGPTPQVGAALCNGTFTYEELASATDGFSDRNLLGQGGFGYVHKGVLSNGKEVAVKQLKMGGHQGEREFRAEVETISQVHHKHLVALVGYCIAGAERLLVYEFVPNNTLEFHLHGKGQPVVDWHTRLKIAIGSAKGLAYLHEDCSPTIIHRDIKAANILLDYNFEAKVSDFGLAKIFTNSGSSVTHMTTRVVGTFGYLAPEYASSGKVTDKSDVYSYGVMLLELITSRPPISNFESATNGSLVNWARPLLTQAIRNRNFESLADPRLQNNYNVDEMACMVACAAACVRLSAWRRPRMSQVVHALAGNLPLSELDDGTRPGHSAMHFPYESLDFDAHNYMENLKRMVMTSDVNSHTTSRYSENYTSEYGLNPSVSSTDTN